MLPIKINIDLDNEDSDNHWGDTIALLLKNAIDREIELQIKKALRGDKEIKRVIRELKNNALKKIMGELK